MYASSCGERLDEIVTAPHEQHPTGLGKVEPLVGIERDRVGPVETGEKVGGRGRGGGGETVGSVDVEPDAGFGADVGEPADRVDSARQRGARGGDDRDRDAPGCAISPDRAGNRLGNEPTIAVDREGPHVGRADPEQLRRALDRVMRLLRAVDRRRRAAEALMT